MQVYPALLLASTLLNVYLSAGCSQLPESKVISLSAGATVVPEL